MTFFPEGRLLLVPGRLAVEQMRTRLLEASAAGVVFAPRVMTFGRLERELAADLDDQRPVASDLARRMILDRAAEAFEMPGLSTGRGLGENLGRIIDDLRLSGIRPDDFGRAAEGILPGRRPDVLVRAWRAYEEMLEKAGLYDGPGLRRRLLEHLKSGAGFIRNISVVEIHGFHRLTNWQITLLRALMDAGLEIRPEIVCPDWVLFDEEEAADSPFLETSRAVRRIESLPDPHGLLDRPWKPPDEDRPEGLAHIIRNFYRLSPESAPSSAGIEITAAPGRYAQAEEAGRRIHQLLAAGVRPDRMAVAVPNLGVYGQLVEDVFRRYDLPLFFRRGAPLAVTAPMRAVISLLRVPSAFWERDAVLDLAASPYLETGLGLSWERAAEVSALAGVTDDRAEGGWEINLNRLAANSKARTRDRTDAARLLEGVRRLKALLAPLGRCRTWTELETHLTSIIEEMEMEQRILASPGPNLRRDGPALEQVRELLFDMAAASRQADADQEKHRPDELVRRLTDAAADRSAGPGARGASGVQVLNFYDLHGLTFDHVFMLGLNENEYPGPQRENWFVNDDQARRINRKLGRPVLSRAAERYRREELMFYHSLAGARSGVHIYHRRTDESGRPALPSMLVDEVLRLWPENALSVTETDDAVPDPGEALSTDEFWAGLAAAAFAPQQSAERLAASRVLGALAETRWAEAAAWLIGRAAGRGPDTGRIDPAVLDNWLQSLPREGDRPLLGARFLEEYGTCPQAFWAARVLGLAPPEEPSDELSNLDRGNLLHNILKMFLSACRDEGLLPLTGRDEETVLLWRVAEAEFATAEAELPVGRRPLWEVRRREMERILANWIKWEWEEQNGLVPARFEWEFGPPSRNSGLEVPLLSGRGLIFRGRIDRLDLGPDAARVVDYKVSADSAKYRKLLKREEMGITSFQAPIYQAAAAREFGRPTRAVWITLRDFQKTISSPGPCTNETLFAAGLEERRRARSDESPNFFNRLEDTWLRLTSGDFRPAEESAACEYCDFASACPSISAREA